MHKPFTFMEIASKYDPKLIENKWYEYWMNLSLFHSTPDDRPPFTIVIPPPNVTGVLHMGHMLNNTIQDALVRRARMQGKNACWVPGTDHASIATEAKVVARLKEKGIDKKSISREEFLDHAWEWKKEHGDIILKQLKKLGASCDWDRTCFTMDDALSESVIDVFIDLFNKGLIYRGIRMVNWDPKALTALSDEEVIYKESNSKLFYLRYYFDDGTGKPDPNQFVLIATTRPETILGDTAIAVHPEDERYHKLKGKNVMVPLINRSVPVIFDEYVDREFGTGCLKITPAHDINDYQLGIKHKLDCIDIFNDNGTLNENAILYIGKDRFEVRRLIAAELAEKSLLEKTEEYLNKVGYSERTNEVIEPKLSMQWFMKMEEMAKPALDVVLDDIIQFHPPKFKNTYRHWMENVKDWCISRQLWWGHRIPAWYLPNREIVVAKTREEAYQKAIAAYGKDICSMDDLKQDEDVLDTWFSSWLWPITVFDGIRNPNNPDIMYYYPTDVLITAPEILFFWVARMIMAGLEYRKEIPFKHVYLTGIVRDKQGRKMSKSLGNSPDPIELINTYGADGVRVGMLLSSPAGNDLLFDESYCEQGRNFSNKIWNAFRLINGWEVSDQKQPEINKEAILWFKNQLNKTLVEIEDHFDKFRLSEALMTIYKLIWDDFCSWFLEIIKPAYQQPIDKQTLKDTKLLFEDLIKVLHPFMPFITEEIGQILSESNEQGCIMTSKMPVAQETDDLILKNFEETKQVVMSIRTIRNEKNIPPKEVLSLLIKKNEESYSYMNDIIQKLCFIDNIQFTDIQPEGASGFIVGTTEFYIPLSTNINIEDELKRLHTELSYTEGFLVSVQKKLSNEKFVSGAPVQVVDVEKKKLSDAEQRISLLKEQISILSKS